MLKSELADATARTGAGPVGVSLTAFDEAVPLFKEAKSDPIVAAVAWFASDGLTQSQALASDPIAAAFAVGAGGLPSAIFGLDPAYRSKWGPLSDRIQAQTG